MTVPFPLDTGVTVRIAVVVTPISDLQRKVDSHEKLAVDWQTMNLCEPPLEYCF